MWRYFRKTTLLLVLWPAIALGFDFSQLIKKDQSAFFPPAVSQKLELLQKFPATWQNVLVLPAELAGFRDLLCPEMKSLGLMCQASAFLEDGVLEDWIRMTSLRRKAYSDQELQRGFQQARAKLAWIGSEDPMFKMVRSDPLDEWNLLVQPIRSFVGEASKLKESDMVIPVRFQRPPTDEASVPEFMDRLQALCQKNHVDCHRLSLIGPHFSTFRNRAQVGVDLNKVSYLGLLGLGLVFLFLFCTRRAQLNILIPIVLTSLVLAAGLTIALFGSIHGLALSFGSGLVGLSFDYGFHKAFHPEKSWVNRSNQAGLLTTLAVMVGLGLSQVPLIRQLAVFSLLGLSIAFILIHLIYERYGSQLMVASTSVRAIHFRYANGLTLVFLLALLGLSPFTQVTLDLSHLEYMSQQDRQVQESLKQQSAGEDYFYAAIPSGKDVRQVLNQEAMKIRQQGGRVLLPTEFLPDLATQEENLKSWTHFNFSKAMADAKDAKLFSPMVNLLAERAKRVFSYQNAVEVPRFLQPWFTPGAWLAVGRGKDIKIEENSHFVSLSKLTRELPLLIHSELLWMLPLIILLVILILAIYLRDIKLIFAACLPGVWGIAPVLILSFLGLLNLSFVSIIGLLIVFGMSIDYGIFATDAIRRADAHRVWTTLLFAYLTTVLGFLPLIFCQHPVLFDLGMSVSIATTGTVLGAFVGVPAWIK